MYSSSKYRCQFSPPSLGQEKLIVYAAREAMQLPNVESVEEHKVQGVLNCCPDSSGPDSLQVVLYMYKSHDQCRVKSAFVVVHWIKVVVEMVRSNGVASRGESSSMVATPVRQ